MNVLAYRGTDDLMDLVVDDLAIAAGGVPPQAAAAAALPAQVGDRRNLMLTGHSLGGALAIIAASRYGLPAVTFNAPGVMDSCALAAPPPGRGGGLAAFLQTVTRCFSNPRILNIRIEADPVSSVFTTGMQPGRTVEYSAPQCGLDLLCRHGIQTCIDAVRARPDGYRPVEL